MLYYTNEERTRMMWLLQQQQHLSDAGRKELQRLLRRMPAEQRPYARLLADLEERGTERLAAAIAESVDMRSGARLQTRQI